MKNKSCQENPISSFDGIISLVDERNCSDTIDFCMEFDSVSHGIVLMKSAIQCDKVNIE